MPQGFFVFFLRVFTGTSLVVQQLRLHAPNSGDMGSIPGQGIKIPHAVWYMVWPKTKSLHSFQLLASQLEALDNHTYTSHGYFCLLS